MKKYLFVILISGFCLSVQADNSHHSAKAKLYNKDGVILGKVEFTQYKDGVGVKVNVAGLPAGFHGFHVHAVGQCKVVNTVPTTPPFASAMGHFKLDTATDHKNHSGDFPVLLVNTNGKVSTEFKTDRFKLTDLFDVDGSAVIIHADPDNYANILPTKYAQIPVATPLVTGADTNTLATGDSGARTACGVITY